MPVLRPAVRLILFDSANRLLLVRFEDSSRQVSWWAAPGGGLKPGENYEEALKEDIPNNVREIVERQFTQVKEAHERLRALERASSAKA